MVKYDIEGSKLVQKLKELWLFLSDDFNNEVYVKSQLSRWCTKVIFIWMSVFLFELIEMLNDIELWYY